MTYPIILTGLERRRCVVVGGGRVAERKVRGLLEAGATPHVVSPSLTELLQALCDEGQISVEPRKYQPSDVRGVFLVFAATNDPDVNHAIANDARAAGALVNVADDGEGGDFFTAGTVRRGDLLLAVSTSGASPALAAHVRSELEERYGAEYGELTALLRGLREGSLRELPPTRRSRFWERLALGTLLDHLRAGDGAGAKEHLRAVLKRT